MRKIFLFIVCMNLVLLVNAQDNKPKRPEDGIRKYWFVMLLKGPNRSQDSATAATIQREHLNNITKLYNEGKLKVAGPFGDSDKWLGIFIFDCPTKEEVEKLLKTDLAVLPAVLHMKYKPGIRHLRGVLNQECRKRNINENPERRKNQEPRCQDPKKKGKRKPTPARQRINTKEYKN